MSEIRYSNANVHALPLLLDIIDSTTFLFEDFRPSWRLHEEIEAASATGLSLGRGEYIIGFQDHSPFGFVGLYENEECGELFGPFLYRDYFRKGLGTLLFHEICNLARSKEMTIIYSLLPNNATWAISFFTHCGFESISDEPEIIKRWCDGLLADKKIPEYSLLMAILLEPEDSVSH